MIAATWLACWDPDPRQVRGALEMAASAVEAQDARGLFKVIDQRSRSALQSIASDRRRSAKLILSDYPAEDRGPALRGLGDGGEAADAQDLFARRCAAPCLAAFAHTVGAPVQQLPTGPSDLVVHTAPGGVLRLHRGKDGWWGLVWNTEALFEERTRAARERLQIEANAEVYRKRRALEHSAGP